MLLRSSRVFASFSTALLLGSLFASTASASPVLIAGDGTEKIHSTQVAILKQPGTSVVTVMPDYQGSLTPFSLIIPVPADVTLADVSALKREFVDRLDGISAPKFAEFWEMDPCDPGEVQQEWERDMTAKASTGFLGTFDTGGGGQKVAKELLMETKAQEKKGEYSFALKSGADLLASLKSRDLILPSGGEESIRLYAEKGYQFLVADVETGRVELVGGSRAQLSPIRFASAEDYGTLPVKFGLPSAAAAQELLIYSLLPDQRTQIKNYDTKAAPTNLTVEFEIKERMGEFYAALHDRFLEKYPNTFLLEYAFPTWDCGKPCPNEPLLLHELLSLGGDAAEAKLPQEIRRPAPPAPSDEDKQKLDAQLEGKSPKEKKDIKKQWEEDREELAARRGMLERQRYVLSRLHYRYTKSTLPEDPTLGPGAAIEGGIKLPVGEQGVADSAVLPAGTNAMQTRYNHLHPDISVLKCDKPERYRWGKPPRTYRGLNKIWVAEDLSRKKRDKVELAQVVLTPVPDLGLPGKAAKGAVAEAPVPPVEEKKDTCGCRTVGIPNTGSTAIALLSGILGISLWRRRASGPQAK